MCVCVCASRALLLANKKIDTQQNTITTKKLNIYFIFFYIYNRFAIVNTSHRGSKGRKCSLPVYTEDDVNDFSDLGIGTSSTSGKSSLSEEFDNHSVIVSIERYLFLYYLDEMAHAVGWQMFVTCALCCF